MTHAIMKLRKFNNYSLESLFVLTGGRSAESLGYEGRGKKAFSSFSLTSPSTLLSAIWRNPMWDIEQNQQAHQFGYLHHLIIHFHFNRKVSPLSHRIGEPSNASIPWRGCRPSLELCKREVPGLFVKRNAFNSTHLHLKYRSVGVSAYELFLTAQTERSIRPLSVLASAMGPRVGAHPISGGDIFTLFGEPAHFSRRSLP